MLATGRYLITIGKSNTSGTLVTDPYVLAIGTCVNCALVDDQHSTTDPVTKGVWEAPDALPTGGGAIASATGFVQCEVDVTAQGAFVQVAIKQGTVGYNGTGDLRVIQINAGVF